MSQAQWIWFNGDFELYHSIQLHSRREEYGCQVPSFWSLSTPYPAVSFGKAYHSDEADTIRLVARCKAYIIVDNTRYPANTDIQVPAGDHAVRVVALAKEGFPSIYINSKYLVTDGSWATDHLAGAPIPVGTWDAYTSPEDDPTDHTVSRHNPAKKSHTALQPDLPHHPGHQTGAQSEKPPRLHEDYLRPTAKPN